MNESELDETKYTAYVPRHAELTLSQCIDRTHGSYGPLVLRCDNTRDRKSRGKSIGSLKLAIERHYRVKLTKISTSYSETYGFLSRTEIRYRIGK